MPEAGSAESKWPADAYTVRQMSAVAKEFNVWMLGGSIPELAEGKRYNCSTVYSSEGALVAKYRKIHLFDVSLPQMTFKESDNISHGSWLTTFQTRELQLVEE